MADPKKTKVGDKSADAKAKATADAKAKATADAKKQPVEKVNIRSVGKRFRRAGVAFIEAGKDYPVDDFTEDQLEAFEAEPMLVMGPAQGE